MMNDHLYGSIWYNIPLCNAFKLKLGHNLKLFLVQIKAATGKDIAEHLIRLAKVIPASLVTVSYTPLQIGIFRYRMDPMKINERLLRSQVGKRLIVV